MKAVADLKVYQALKEIGDPYTIGSYALYEAFEMDENIAKDVDICLETDKTQDEIAQFLKDFGCKNILKNKIGGFKLVFDGVEYDIWRVRDTLITKWDLLCIDENGGNAYGIFEAVIRALPLYSQHCCISPVDDKLHCLDSFRDFLNYGFPSVSNISALNLNNMSEKANQKCRELRKVFRPID